MLLIYGLCILLAVMSLLLSGRGQVSAFLIIVIVSGVVLYLVTRRARQALDRSSYPDQAEPPIIEEIRDLGTDLTGGDAQPEQRNGRP